MTPASDYRLIHLVAGMAGLRQCELLGLLYSVDRAAVKIRAARDIFTRGHMREGWQDRTTFKADND